MHRLSRCGHAFRNGDLTEWQYKTMLSPEDSLTHFLSPLGLTSLNFLLSAGQSPGGLALPPGSVPTLALPYILVPSSALSHYPLVAYGHQPAGTDAHAGLSFTLPATMSPAHFVVGTAGPYDIAGASELGGSPRVQSPSTPEQTRTYGSAPVPPHSPAGSRQQLDTPLTEPQVRTDNWHTQLHKHTHCPVILKSY